jgi:hypothetical protein
MGGPQAVTFRARQVTDKGPALVKVSLSGYLALY